MKRLRSLMSKVLDIPPESITDNTSPENVDSWDSLNALMLTTEIENEFKVTLTMDEVQSVTCVKDIKNIVSRHGISLVE